MIRSVTQVSQEDEMVRSRFRSGPAGRPLGGTAASSVVVVLDPSASLLLASSHRPIDSVRSQPAAAII